MPARLSQARRARPRPPELTSTKPLADVLIPTAMSTSELDAFRARIRSNEGRPVHLRRTLAWDPSPERSRQGIYLLSFLEQVFTQLTGGQLDERSRDGGTTYNWGTDVAHLTHDGDGVLFAQKHFGVLPGDGIDSWTHLMLPDDTHVAFALGEDYMQREVALDGWGTDEAAVARALEAVVQAVVAYRDALAGPGAEPPQ